jgi:hypothetical protein
VKPAGRCWKSETEFINAWLIVHLVLRKCESCCEHGGAHGPMHHIHPHCLNESHSASFNAAVRLADERNWKADLWTLTAGHHCIHQHASCMAVVISAVAVAVGLTPTWTL